MKSRHTKIDVGDQEIKISRPVTIALQEAMASYSLVIVGEPGAGKSGVLYTVADALMAEDNDVIFVTVDSFDENSRKFLKLTDLLENILLDWHAEKPGYLIIDALDAARSTTLRKTVIEFLELIHAQPGRWQIIVSIRKFDLRYNHKLQEMFVGTPPTNYQDPEFRHLRHLNIPLLTDAELGQFATQLEVLAPLIHNAHDSFRELIRVPFNLRLLGEIYAIDKDVFQVQTQIELLERFWLNRIGRDDKKDTLLKNITQVMVDEGKLQVARSHINVSDESIQELLSVHILAEWQPTPTSKPQSRVLEYSHHVLFDYAVSRLLLADMVDEFIKQLIDKSSLVLTVRPSLLFHFQHIWQDDPSWEWFWQFAEKLFQSEIPSIGKIIPANVAVNMTQDTLDFAPLLERLMSSIPSTKKAAIELTHHVINVLSTNPKETLVGKNAKGWTILVRQLSNIIDDDIIPLVFRLLKLLCEQADQFIDSQESDCNDAGQRLLHYAWNQSIRNRWFVIAGIETVARTFASKPADSATILRRALEPQHLEKYGYEEMPALIKEIGFIMQCDSVLTRDVYTAVFSYNETSQETVFWGGEILGLQTTRTQNYDSARYKLAQAFPQFLAYAPAIAIEILASVLDAYFNERFSEHGLRLTSPEPFVFQGNPAHITIDIYPYAPHSEQDKPIKMLNNFTEYLKAIQSNEELLKNVLDSIAQHHHHLTVWQRVLVIGTQNPTTMGQEILSLAWAMPILATSGLAEMMSNFLVAIYPSLTQQEKEQIENAIRVMPENCARIQARYLSLLSNQLSTQEAHYALVHRQVLIFG